jgi:phage terminase large subunit
MVLDLAAQINPTPRQREAFAGTLQYQFLLYGGAMGGGKSYFLRWWCIRECVRLYALYGIRGVRIGLFSMDYPTLLDRQISKMVYEIPEHIGRIQKTQTDGFNLTLSPELGGGTVALRNLDNPSKYNSAEFAGIAIEELTENPEVIFHELRKRIRWPGIPAGDMHFVAAANPGGIGHAWVKKLWIDRDFPPEMLSMASQFGYIPARAQDNPHLDEKYYEQLLSLPEEMRKAYAEGSWDIFAGQYFKEWRKDVHVVEAFAIPWHWKIERSSDWGEANPCAHLWTATDPEGYSYVIGEVYGAGLKVAEQAARILEWEQGKNVQKIGILDSACWDVSGRAESIAEQFRRCGVINAPSAKGPGSRVAGWNMVRTALSVREGRSAPALRVFSTCTNLIRTLPAMVHDKLHPEDLDTKAEDHACDALRYKFQGMAEGFKTPDEEMTEEDAEFMQRARKEAHAHM